MRRHTYSTDNDYRIKTVAILGILAYVTGSWLASILSGLSSFVLDLAGTGEEILPLITWILSPLTNLGLQPDAWVPTTGALFAVYFWAFNKHLWRWNLIQQTPLVDTPDLAGTWTVHVLQTESSGEEPDKHRAVEAHEDIEGHVIEKVSGEAHIEQSWRKIQIAMDFDYSTSTSLGASFITDSARPRLNYFYRNEPTPQSNDAAQVHYGMVDLRIDVEENVLEGEYFTDRFRNTSGRIVFRRVETQGN